MLIELLKSKTAKINGYIMFIYGMIEPLSIHAA